MYKRLTKIIFNFLLLSISYKSFAVRVAPDPEQLEEGAAAEIVQVVEGDEPALRAAHGCVARARIRLSTCDTPAARNIIIRCGEALTLMGVVTLMGSGVVFDDELSIVAIPLAGCAIVLGIFISACGETDCCGPIRDCCIRGINRIEPE